MATAALLTDVHVYGVAKTSILSGFQVMNAIPVIEVIRALNSQGINFVLVGAHGLAGWRQRPRATEDVDVVVMARHQKKAAKLLTSTFPNLDAEDHEVVIRLRNRESKEVAIDLIKPNQPLYKVAFKHVIHIEMEDQPCKIPSLEMALAMKFAPMISLTREDDKKYIDAGDFIRIVKVNPEIDMEKLASLGDLVYPGGGKELVAKVEDVRAGRKLSL